MTNSTSTVASERLPLKTAMLKYCIQSGLFWIAFCPMAYASTFMLGRGLSASAVGITMAVGNALALVIQPWVATNADGDGSIDIRSLAVGLAIGTTAAFGVCCFAGGDFLLCAGIAVGYMFAQNLIAISNSVSVYYINRGAKINYGLARGIGSLTWSLTSFLLGQLMVAYTTDVIIWLALGCNIAMTVGFMLLPTPKDVPALTVADDSGEAVEQSGMSYGEFLRENVPFLLVILGFSLCFIMGNILMSYAILIFGRVGGDEGNMGLALAISAISELPAMWSMEALSKRIDTGKIMVIAAIGYILKHVVILLASSVGMLYVGYALQMLSYAVYTPCSVYYVNQRFGEGDKNKALGLMVMVNPISAIIGNLFGGILVDSVGIFASLIFGTVLTVVGSLCALYGLRASSPKALER